MSQALMIYSDDRYQTESILNPTPVIFNHGSHSSIPKKYGRVTPWLRNAHRKAHVLPTLLSFRIQLYSEHMLSFSISLIV